MRIELPVEKLLRLDRRRWPLWVNPLFVELYVEVCYPEHLGDLLEIRGERRGQVAVFDLERPMLRRWSGRVGPRQRASAAATILAVERALSEMQEGPPAPRPSPLQIFTATLVLLLWSEFWHFDWWDCEEEEILFPPPCGECGCIPAAGPVE